MFYENERLMTMAYFSLHFVCLGSGIYKLILSIQFEKFDTFNRAHESRSLLSSEIDT